MSGRAIGLRARVARGVILFGALLLAVQSVAIVVITEQQEEEFVDQILLDEAQRLREQRPEEATSGLLRYIVRNAGDRERLPPQVRDLSPGLHEYMEGEREFHVAVQPVAGATYYLLYDATRHEDRVIQFRTFMLVSIALSIAMLVGGGIWLSGRLVKQVSDLAQRVDVAQPGEPQTRLATNYRDSEVRTLARAFDRYAQRVADLVSREKEFTANVSHELRTPLTTIQTSCELLLSDPALNGKAHTRVAQIAAGAERMGEVAEALLLLAREAPMEPDVIALRELAEEVAAPLLAAIAAKGLVFEVRIAPDAQLRTHRTALAMLLSNLLKNALTYTDQGRITVDYDGSALTVSDTGIGIAAEDLPRVFERSFRGTNARMSGTGLGLAIVKRLADRFGWHIGVASRVGEGSTFSVALNPARNN